MKTLPRTATKKIADVAARTTEIFVYSLDNNFHAEGFTPEDPAAWLADRMHRYGDKLQSDGENAQIRSHSNLWYEWTLSPATEQPKAQHTPKKDTRIHVTPEQWELEIREYPEGHALILNDYGWKIQRNRYYASHEQAVRAMRTIHHHITKNGTLNNRDWTAS